MIGGSSELLVTSNPILLTIFDICVVLAQNVEPLLATIVFNTNGNSTMRV